MTKLKVERDLNERVGLSRTTRFVVYFVNVKKCRFSTLLSAPPAWKSILQILGHNERSSAEAHCTRGPTRQQRKGKLMNRRGADFAGSSPCRERCNKRKRRWRMEETRPENKRAGTKGSRRGDKVFRGSRELIPLSLSLSRTSRALYNSSASDG